MTRPWRSTYCFPHIPGTADHAMCPFGRRSLMDRLLGVGVVCPCPCHKRFARRGQEGNDGH